jgi:hypothetical protein
MLRLGAHMIPFVCPCNGNSCFCPAFRVCTTGDFTHAIFLSRFYFVRVPYARFNYKVTFMTRNPWL